MRPVAPLVAMSLVLMLAPAAAQDAPRVEMVLRETITAMPRGERQEIQVLTATLLPGQSTPFHTHAFPVTVLVLEGTFTLDLQGYPPVVVTAGRAMIEPPNVPMTGHNRSASETTRVVIFYVADPGTPFLHPIR